MAPTQTKLPHRTLPTTTKTPHKAPTKHLKRASKHASLLTRISSTAPGSKISKKRRRPSKKLVTSLNDLADALPATSASGSVDGRAESGRVQEANGRDGQEEGVKIKHKSLKSKKGAGRKKEKVVKMEMERFGLNMARMCKGGGERADGRMDVGSEGAVKGDREMKGGVEGSSKERWAAIRGFISQTMERKGEGTVGG